MKTCLQILDVSYLPTNQLLFACRSRAPGGTIVPPPRLGVYLFRGPTIAQHINVCTLCMQYTYRVYILVQSINAYLLYKYIYTICMLYRILFDFSTFARAAYCPDIYYTPAILSKLNFCIHIAYRFCSYHICTAYADHMSTIYIL